jgi:hypothetical protein
MKMTYTRKKNETYEYVIKTDPPEAIYWSTTKLKKTDVHIKNIKDQKLRTKIRDEVFNDIVKTEGNPPQKPHRVSKKCKTTIANDVKARKKQQKTRRRNTKA